MEIPGRAHWTEVCHNTKIKCYPSGLKRVTVCTAPIFREPGWEPEHNKPRFAKPQNPDEESRADNVKRAKEKCFDIAMMNKFDYFITWTLSADKIDRYNPDEVSKQLKKFLNNMVCRYDLKYIIIPEHHKDGAIHMHGLISGNIKLKHATHKKSGKPMHTTSGKPIYNMPQWKYGWSTAIETYGDTEHVARYITKYITKDFQKIFGNFTMRVGISSASHVLIWPM